MLTRPFAECPRRLGLADGKLRLRAHADGVHHRTTRMTRTPAACTLGEVSRSARERFAGEAQPNNDLASVYHVGIFVAALTAFLAAVGTLRIHPIVAVLLALGAMSLLLHSLAELLHVSQVQVEQCRPHHSEFTGNYY